jgi:hypothetical protein
MSARTYFFCGAFICIFALLDTLFDSHAGLFGRIFLWSFGVYLLAWGFAKWLYSKRRQ